MTKEQFSKFKINQAVDFIPGSGGRKKAKVVGLYDETTKQGMKAYAVQIECETPARTLQGNMQVTEKPKQYLITDNAFLCTPIKNK